MIYSKGLSHNHFQKSIMYSPMFVLLKPTFLLPLRPTLLVRILRSKAERSPSDSFLYLTNFTRK